MDFFDKKNSISYPVLVKFDSDFSKITILFENNDTLVLTPENSFYEHFGNYYFINSDFGNLKANELPSWVIKKFRKKNKLNHSSLFSYAIILFIAFNVFYFISYFEKFCPHFIEEWLYQSTVSLLRIDTSIDHKQNERILKIQELLSNIEPEIKNLKIFISPSKEVNAMALPDNHIIVHQGLIDNCQSEEELIGIMAHELGHLKGRHVIKMYFQLYILNMINLLLGGYDFLNLFVSLKYSRECEREADAYAVEYLKKLKLTANGLIEFFKRNKDNSHFKILSTHPANKDRIEFFQKSLEA